MTTRTTIKVENGIVTINGKRAKYFYTGGDRRCFVRCGIIVKLNDDRLRQSSRELRIWEQIIEPCDRKYFVAPIAGQIRGHGWIAQRVVKFRRGRRPEWAYRLVERIALKYGILMDSMQGVKDYGKIYPINWAMTMHGQPIIYDWGW